MASAVKRECQRVVRVWFAGHRIAEYRAAPALAARYAAAMTRRFPSLQVTNCPVGQPPNAAGLEPPRATDPVTNP